MLRRHGVKVKSLVRDAVDLTTRMRKALRFWAYIYVMELSGPGGKKSPSYRAGPANIENSQSFDLDQLRLHTEELLQLRFGQPRRGIPSPRVFVYEVAPHRFCNLVEL